MGGGNTGQGTISTYIYTSHTTIICAYIDTYLYVHTCLFDILHTSIHIICIYVRSMSSSKPCFSLTFSPGDYRFAAFQGRWRLDFGGELPAWLWLFSWGKWELDELNGFGGTGFSNHRCSGYFGGFHGAAGNLRWWPFEFALCALCEVFFCWSGGVTGKTWAHWFFRIGAFRSSFLAVFRLFTGKIWVFLPIGGLLSWWPLGQLFFFNVPGLYPNI